MNSDTVIHHLRHALGPQAVVSAPDALRTYDADASMIVSHAPQAVALPADSAQAAEVVRIAVSAGLPVVARGAGTGIAGGAIPLRGGVLVSTARMGRVLSVEPASRRATVQAGTVNADLNARLAPLGLQFAPDPSSQRASTIGGNLSTNAGGPHCLKYGVTTNHILAVEFVNGAGELVWTGDGAPEAAGYDLTGLLVGSEGTFGLVTQAMVRLTALPEAVRVVLALFPSVVAASAAVSRIIAAGSLPTSLEVMDHNAIRSVNGAYGLGLPEAEGTTLLIVEVDGVADGLDLIMAEILEICRGQGAFDLRPARSAEEQARVWTARKSVAAAIGRLAPAYYLVDTVVPRTRLPLMMEHVERLRHEHGMEVCNVFHAGDGNLHPLVLYDPRDPEQVRRAHAIAHGVLHLSIAQGGVISGEHGIGVEKQDYLPLLLSPNEMQLHAAIYTIFNPDDRFNPGKIFPADVNPHALAAARRARIADCRLQIAETEPQSAICNLQSAIEMPASIEELSQLVAACHRAGAPVRPTGAGLRKISGVLQYEPDDLTIGVGAGMTLAELRATLAENGQILPLDVARPDDVTIGGLVAAAADGPRRLGYGTLRDWVLALTVVEADGTVSRLGAQVVKNVTGYDLSKLFVGSRGTLGVIASVSLKVFPRPKASATLLVACPGRDAAFALAADIAASKLQPTAVEYIADCRLQIADLGAQPAIYNLQSAIAVRAEGHPAAVGRHRRELAELAERRGLAAPRELSGGEEDALWDAAAAVADTATAPDEALIRLSAAPAELREALAHAEALAGRRGLGLSVSARALSGVAYLRARGALADLAGLYGDLGARWRHAHLLAGPDGLLAGAPTWGAPHAALALMRAIKAELDPYGTMNPGAYVV
ncbi:FAD-binding oxidoreductase [Oscillochloris sp. ZM17-4]|uniref:FAD-binding oxidoreductase n=1 Tax=Oscillochloris sp. ZM17-4 TaxID=2866714 RepID=UPI001C73A9E1|nr:FAD-binding oxidoreductase [Oscillochloris sp. ZM17-4]MBX0328160.1 FAD-binding oxidoreductase [Oscillochloris sp. ZM17-4]